MPSSSRFKCYFGCANCGTLHRFPKPEFPHVEKFNVWKKILDRGLQEKENIYIYNQVRLCSKHFEHYYISSSHRLISNAVPTLCLNAADDDDDDAVVAVTATAPREFSWQRSSEAIPCADDVEIQTDVSLTAPDSAGGDSDDDMRPIDSQNDRLHSDCKCNGCGSEIFGYRYTCVQCCDVDLCSACEASGAHPEHYVLRLPRPEPAGAVKCMLEAMHRLLEHVSLPHVHHDRVKKEEIDEDDPLSIGLEPPEPVSFDGFETEEHTEEKSKEEILPPSGDELLMTHLKALRTESISNIPTETARMQPLDKACLDVGNCTSKKVNLSEVKPILNGDSVVQYTVRHYRRRTVVRPCDEGTETSDVGHGLSTSGTRLRADARVTATTASAPELLEKPPSRDNPIRYEAKRIKLQSDTESLGHLKTKSRIKSVCESRRCDL